MLQNHIALLSWQNENAEGDMSIAQWNDHSNCQRLYETVNALRIYLYVCKYMRENCLCKNAHKKQR